MTEEQIPSPEAQTDAAAAEPGVGARRRTLAVAFWLFAANCAVFSLGGLGYLDRALPAGEISALGWLHFPLAYLSHFAVISLVAVGLTTAGAGPLGRKWLLLWTAPLVLSLFYFGFYVDGLVHDLYGRHFNAGDWNLLITPGVEDSLYFTPAQWFKGAAIVAAWYLAWHLAARVACLLTEWRPGLVTRLPRYGGITLAAVVLAILVEKGLYAYADAAGRRDILFNSKTLPFYPEVTCKRFLRRLGVKVDRQYDFDTSLGVKYPLKPVKAPADSPRHNVLWVVIEGWRFDSLDPEVSPKLSAFGKRCLVAEKHYSSGNCTRFGIFGMFYGLDGFYWGLFLADKRGPVLLDLLRELKYDFLVMGSANFRNPELRLSCFVKLRDDQLVHGRQLFRGKSYLRDLAMVARFGGFLEKRDGKRPFFCFMFLDSTHSPYRFQELPGFKPPFTGYREGVSYDRLADDERERRSALARYRNSAAYVDHMIGGALADLERRGLLEKTIVVVTGDHGEEFGELGYNGHNSSFNDYQVRTPLLLHFPGVEPGRITGLTSHVDVAPTTLRLLGVTAPPEDYCQGLDMLGPQKREYAVSATYQRAAIITGDGTRIIFPMKSYRFSTLELRDAGDKRVSNRAELLELHGPKLGEVLRAASRFKR